MQRNSWQSFEKYTLPKIWTKYRNHGRYSFSSTSEDRFLAYRKVTSSRLSQLAAHLMIFRRFIRGKFDAHGQKSSKLNSRPVYCLPLYGILILFKKVHFLMPKLTLFSIYVNQLFSADATMCRKSNFVLFCL